MFLNVSNINFSYKEEKVLNDISFDLEKGKTIAVVGASGSGKSTLLRLLSNIIKKEEILSGDIIINNKLPEEYIKTGELSFMFQEPTLMPNLNVRKNIEFPLKLLKRKIIKEEIDELIKLVGLEKSQNKLPNALSGGMKTRVALARAFITSPELLLLDEPFSALDISWKFNLYGYLEEIHRKYNTTIVMVTHDIQEAILLADKIFVLSKAGTKIKEKEIYRKEQLIFENETINKYLAEMQNIYLELQSDILVDGVRKNITKEKAIQLTENLKTKILNKEELLEKDMDIYSIKNYVNDETIKRNLKFIWKKSNSIPLKYNVLWRYLEIDNLTENEHDDVLNFCINNRFFLNNIIKQDNFFLGNEDVVFSNVMSRLRSKNFIKSKKWIYLFFLAEKLHETKHKQQLIIFLNSIIENTSEYSNLPYFKKSAFKILKYL